MSLTIAVCKDSANSREGDPGTDTGYEHRIVYPSFVRHGRRDFPNDSHRRWAKVAISGHRKGSKMPASFSDLAAVFPPLVCLRLEDGLLWRVPQMGLALCIDDGDVHESQLPRSE